MHVCVSVFLLALLSNGSVLCQTQTYFSSYKDVKFCVYVCMRADVHVVAVEYIYM